MAVTSRLTERTWRGPFGWRPPMWAGLVCFLALAVGVGAMLAERRHPVVGVAAGLFYGITFGAVVIAGDRMTTWTDRHRFADSLLLFPLLGFALLLLTPWRAWVCLAVTAGFGTSVVALAAVLRRRRGPTAGVT